MGELGIRNIASRLLISLVASKAVCSSRIDFLDCLDVSTLFTSDVN